jgi:hypothetical protein
MRRHPIVKERERQNGARQWDADVRPCGWFPDGRLSRIYPAIRRSCPFRFFTRPSTIGAGKVLCHPGLARAGTPGLSGSEAQFAEILKPSAFAIVFRVAFGLTQRVDQCPWARSSAVSQAGTGHLARAAEGGGRGCGSCGRLVRKCKVEAVQAQTRQPSRDFPHDAALRRRLNGPPQ